MSGLSERLFALAADRGPGYETGRYCFGSGFLIRGRIVLTCAHVVEDAAEILLDDASGRRFTGHVYQTGHPKGPSSFRAPDLALVEIEDYSIDAEPFRIARLDRQAAGSGSIDSVEAYGWPWFMDLEDDESVVRSLLATEGSCNLLSRVREGLLQVKVSEAPPPLVPAESFRLKQPLGNESNPHADVRSPWKGFSGAPIIVRGHLVAVAALHAPSEGISSLSAIPITALDAALDSPNWGPGVHTPDLWWEALGVSDSQALPVISAGKPLPASITDHRSAVASMHGFRSSLSEKVLSYVPPSPEAAWHPANLFRKLTDPVEDGCLLLVGHGGIGKSRTLLEVAELAVKRNWTVFHIRTGDGSQVLEFLVDYARSSISPILVVIDYLNTCVERGIDVTQLLATIKQHRLGEVAHMAVIASARTGWMLTSSKGTGAESFERIDVNPSIEEVRPVCQAIARQTAPLANAQLGTAKLLELTGVSRPILTLLIAQQIEYRVSTGRTSHRGAVLDSRNLRQWLEIRLSDDRLIPERDENVWSPRVDSHIQAAAAVLSSTPATQDQLKSVARVILGDENTSSHLIRLLEKMGWLSEYHAVYETIHDVVVDFLVESVLFWSSTDELRPFCTPSLLDAVSANTVSFDHAVSALDRLVLERESTSRDNEALYRELSVWLDSRTPKVRDLLQSDPETAEKTASNIIRSHLWENSAQRYWTSLFEPTLTTLDGGQSSFPILLAVCRAMPLYVPPNVVDRVLEWIGPGKRRGSEYLLSVLLMRDLSPTQCQQTIQLGIRWLSRWGSHIVAYSLIRALLRRSELHEEQLVQVLSEAMSWLKRYAQDASASYILYAVLTRSDIPTDVLSEVAQIALQWLKNHGKSAASRFVLQSLLRQKALSQDTFESAVNAALMWLELNVHSQVLPEPIGKTPVSSMVASINADNNTETESGASFVIRELLSRSEDVPRSTLAVVIEYAITWLGNNAESRLADFMLNAIVAQTNLSLDTFSPIMTSATKWLAKHDTTADAVYVLQKLLGRMDLPADTLTTTLASTASWLKEYGTTTEARYLLQKLLSRTDLPADTLTTTLASTASWLKEYGTTTEAQHMLQMLLGRTDLPAQTLTIVLATAETWLKTNPDSSQAPHLLNRMLARDDLPTPTLDTTLAFATTWLSNNTDSQRVRYVLNWILAREDLPPSALNLSLSTAATWLGEYGSTGGAGLVLQKLLSRSDLPLHIAATSLTTATQWLDNYPDSPQTQPLLSCILLRKDLSALTLDSILAASTTWLLKPDTSQAHHLLGRVLRRDDLPGPVLATTLETAMNWIDNNQGSPHAQFILADLLARDDLPVPTLIRTMYASIRWLEGRAAHSNAHVLLKRLLDRADVPADVWAVTVDYAVTWLRNNPMSSKAHAILNILLNGVLVRTDWSKDSLNDVLEIADSLLQKKD